MIRQCVICGAQFNAKSSRRSFCYKVHYHSCPVCGKQVVTKDTYHLDECCSKECSRQKASATTHDRYDVWPGDSKDASERRAATNISRYGVACVFESDEIKETIASTNLDRYGNENAASNQLIRDKIRHTNMLRYGGVTPMSSKEVVSKVIQSQKSRFGDVFFNSDYYKSNVLPKIQSQYGALNVLSNPQIYEKSRQCVEDRYGVKYACMTEQARSQCGAISKMNQNFGMKLDAAGVVHSFEFALDKYQYDIKCSNYLIEIDPTYTHNIVGNHWGSRTIDETYHLNKTAVANANGYQCIHVFDWDNIDKIIDIIRPKEKTIYARKCEVRDVEKTVADSFLVDNHLQGTVRGQTVRLGLYYQDELVLLMTFGQPRYNKNFQWELLRLCTSSRLNVVGGASKLFKFFINQYDPTSVISYCDRSKFSGCVYEKLGMRLHHVTEPAKVWSRKFEHITDNVLRQRGYDQLFGTSYGKGTSNEQLMLDSEWLPIYDCGQLVYSYDKKD